MIVQDDKLPPAKPLSSAQQTLLNERIKRARSGSTGRTEPPGSIPRRTAAGRAPLSFAQEGLWLLHQFAPDSDAYNVCQAVHLRGSLNIPALEHGLAGIVRRHEALRSNFVTEDDQPVQVIAPDRTLALRQVSIDTASLLDVATQVRRIAEEDARTPFDLARDLLIRALLIRVNATHHTLVLTVHHLISDAWSMGVLFHELAAFYAAHATGARPALAELPIQFADFAAWERSPARASSVEKLLVFWRKQLAGEIPALELPADFPRRTLAPARGGVREQRLALPLSRAIKTLAQAESATLFMTLLAAFQVLLHRWTNQDDIVVGSPVAGRRRVEVEKLVGYFVNTLVFRASTAENPSFRQMLARTRHGTLDALTHQDLPFERLVRDLQPDRSGTTNPLFQVLFVLQSALPAPLELPGLSSEGLDIDPGTAKFDLTLSMIDEPQGLRAAIEFNADLFAPPTIERLLHSFETLLEGIVACPDERIGNLPVMPVAELRKVLVKWNETTLAHDRALCVHEAFERQAERTPDAIALVAAQDRWTYARLDAASDRLASALRAQGVGPDVWSDFISIARRGCSPGFSAS